MNLERGPILRSFSWLAGGQVARLVLGFGVSLLLIRSLGPEQFGLYSYVLALAGLFASLPQLGIHHILMRDLARSGEAVLEDLGTAFVLKVGGSVAALLLASAAAYWTHPEDAVVRVGVALVAGAFLFRGLDVIETLFLANQRAGAVTGVRTLVVVVMSLVKVGLIARGAPVLHFFMAVALDAALVALGFAILHYRSGHRIQAWRFSSRRAYGLLSEGWPMLVSAAAMVVQARVDQVMIGDLLGRAALGQYSAALRLLEAMAFLPVALQTAYAPSLARAKQADAAVYRRVLLGFYRAMILPALGLIAFLVWFGEDLVRVLFGAEYGEAGVLLGFFALRLFFTSVGLARTIFVTNERLFRFSMGTALAGVIVNIGLNLLWIPRFGLEGAVAASLISFTVSGIALDVFHPRARLHVRTMVEALLPPRRGTG
ncbi:MAG: flippase [Deltaproteobacteria bacterium]|nr:flippase [Deltaproteobacteria bacterium]MBW2446016.1 flippase [Deltaproteobacteria bacterium]